MRRTAFSLLEGVLVIAILSVLSAIALPHYSQFAAQQRLESSARRVLLDLANAKRRAQLTSTNQRINFEPAHERYTQIGLSDQDHPGRPTTLYLNKEPYSAVIVSAQFGGDSVLIFNGFGIPDTGGTVVIAVGSLQQTITVDGPTGRIFKLEPLVLDADGHSVN